VGATPQTLARGTVDTKKISGHVKSDRPPLVAIISKLILRYFNRVARFFLAQLSKKENTYIPNNHKI
jgi:hypothetical protein